ncbi:alpha/beta hydrolase [Enterococcus xiangfangensis]|uniref:Alpha/beta fold hydrolase n=1 Tax=Enterococcus xiangfangensis TaxID=1296537 RepID=A0ABU3FAW1_9ENTE|nr:alpha/beta fold hydrolase [Enterococcus xiangfangensis]MBM7712665.1 carboxylesterase [Enterococcus xiangfangensis]MDT2759625.1 alpha/beta fold hydrolase [Enterococcus xiangfangensis]NBK08615.1 alpha/beta fold hydrolase [Enterococcus asini]
MIQTPDSLFLPHGSRAVLLLHAYSGSPNDVRMLARFLEKLNYTVYVPMYTGHGTTDPLDILQETAEGWWQDSQHAVEFLRAQGYQEIAVFGLSMGGIFATRLLSAMSDELIGGGFFCSPIAPVKTNVTENFLLYARQVLERTNGEMVEAKIESYRSLVEQQLATIEEQARHAFENLAKIDRPFFMAQAGQDEMIEAKGVFQTAEGLQQTTFTLNWYPKSGHVITVGPERRQFEQDVADFLAGLGWRENNGEKNN